MAAHHFVHLADRGAMVTVLSPCLLNHNSLKKASERLSCAQRELLAVIKYNVNTRAK